MGGHRDMHAADRLLCRAAAGPGDAGAGDGDIRFAAAQAALSHGARNLFGDGAMAGDDPRREERRVGKECGGQGRYRWWPSHENKKKNDRSRKICSYTYIAVKT